MTPKIARSRSPGAPKITNFQHNFPNIDFHAPAMAAPPPNSRDATLSFLLTGAGPRDPRDPTNPRGPKPKLKQQTPIDYQKIQKALHGDHGSYVKGSNLTAHAYQLTTNEHATSKLVTNKQPVTNKPAVTNKQQLTKDLLTMYDQPLVITVNKVQIPRGVTEDMICNAFNQSKVTDDTLTNTFNQSKVVDDTLANASTGSQSKANQNIKDLCTQEIKTMIDPANYIKIYNASNQSKVTDGAADTINLSKVTDDSLANASNQSQACNDKLNNAFNQPKVTD